MDLGQVTLLASGAVVVVQQILKWHKVPVSFANKYPVLTNIGLSIVGAVVVNYKGFANLHGFNDWLTEVGLISLVAAVAYNQLIGRSKLIKDSEGEGEL